MSIDHSQTGPQNVRQSELSYKNTLPVGRGPGEKIFMIRFQLTRPSFARKKGRNYESLKMHRRKDPGPKQGRADIAESNSEIMKTFITILE